jgi:hypothetical protein
MHVRRLVIMSEQEWTRTMDAQQTRRASAAREIMRTGIVPAAADSESE